MQVQIVSAAEAADNIGYIVRGNINLVSIRDTNPSPGLADCYRDIDQSGIKHIFKVRFDDLEYDLDPKYNRRERPPAHEDIQSIIDWAREKMVSNPTGFIVHCTAGVSRSSAVAILIKSLHDPENALKIINPLIHSPNSRVLEIGERILDGVKVKDKAREIEDNASIEFMKTYDERMKNGKRNTV